MSLLIADSGSTKTDWCLIRKNKKTIFFQSQGINPFLQTPEAISNVLREEMPFDLVQHTPEKIFFFGAGAATTEKQLILQKVLKAHFNAGKIIVQSDMMAAALALCGDQKGLVCILGTGSSSCYYNGEKIKERQPSLGYIAGDEGSGNHMGKRILQYYTYGTFDEQLRMDFEMRFGKDLTKIIAQLYKDPFPNRYLASFVTLLAENRGHYMAENIIEDCFNDFFQRSILKYRQSWKHPLFFCGSIAHAFQDILLSLCNQYELELGKIAKSPMEGLVKYYKSQL